MIRAYLALGSNLGDRLAYLQAAVDDLCERFVNVEVSPVYETDPVGGPGPCGSGRRRGTLAAIN